MARELSRTEELFVWERSETRGVPPSVEEQSQILLKAFEEQRLEALPLSALPLFKKSPAAAKAKKDGASARPADDAGEREVVIMRKELSSVQAQATSHQLQSAVRSAPTTLPPNPGLSHGLDPPLSARGGWLSGRGGKEQWAQAHEQTMRALLTQMQLTTGAALSSSAAHRKHAAVMGAPSSESPFDGFLQRQVRSTFQWHEMHSPRKAVPRAACLAAQAIEAGTRGTGSQPQPSPSGRQKRRGAPDEGSSAAPAASPGMPLSSPASPASVGAPVSDGMDAPVGGDAEGDGGQGGDDPTASSGVAGTQARGAGAALLARNRLAGGGEPAGNRQDPPPPVLGESKDALGFTRFPLTGPLQPGSTLSLSTRPGHSALALAASLHLSEKLRLDRPLLGSLSAPPSSGY